MKKILCLALIVFLLPGCTGENTEEEFLSLRSRLIGRKCSFDVKITADYGSEFYEFTLSCSGTPEGNLEFAVVAPETIAGIRGSISSDGGKLNFEDMALAFSLLADGQLSPVSAPWVLMKALQSGYLLSAGTEGGYSRATIRDSYDRNALTVDVWLSSQVPVHAEILWENRRILTMEVENFQIG